MESRGSIAFRSWRAGALMVETIRRNNKQFKLAALERATQDFGKSKRDAATTDTGSRLLRRTMLLL